MYRVIGGAWSHYTFARQKVVGLHSWQTSKVGVVFSCLDFYFSFCSLLLTIELISCFQLGFDWSYWLQEGHLWGFLWASGSRRGAFIITLQCCVCLKDNWILVDTKLILVQLPDYFEIVENPMDFSTARKKLDEGAYTNLEQFEVGLRLFCLLTWICK